MGTFHRYERLLAVIPGTVLWGCLGGFFLAAGYFLMERLWDPVLGYNYTLSPVFQFQVLGSFIIIFWTLGLFAADLFRTEKSTRPGLAFIGLFSGICTALVFIAVLVVWNMVSHPSIMQYADDPFHFRIFLDMLLRQWYIPLGGFLLVSGILQAFGVMYQGSRQETGDSREGIPRKQAITGMVYRHRIILFALLAILIIPPGLGYLGMSTGIIAEKSGCCAITDSVDVVRTGPDSIHIVMQPDPEKHTGSVPSVKIYLGEKDVSTQLLIAESGFADTIDPPEGLMYQSGASVTLRGSNVLGNETVPTHIRIIVIYPDTGTGTEICNRKI